LEEQGVEYAFIPSKRNAVFALARLLKDVRPLVFHSHFETFDLTAMTLKFLQYRDAKLVWHFHSLAELTLHQRLKDAVKVRLLGRIWGDLFIAVADGTYRNAVSRGFPTGRLSLHHNGVDVSRFLSARIHRQDARRTLGASNGQTVFLSLGYNPVIKGVDLFIKAAAEVHQKNPGDYLFLIVGRKETREFVSRLSESSQLGKALQILDPTEDFPRLLNGVDVLVAPSRTEGFSYAVLEAMSCGKLALCSDIPGVREIYGKQPGVWLFESEDWQKLSELMRKAGTLPCTEREQLGESNSQFVQENHSIEQWASRVVGKYKELVTRA
jgi:glycosyltransferase involved in cell wall biosynthesis